MNRIEQKLYMKEYNQRPEVKKRNAEHQKKYRSTSEAKAKIKKYNQQPHIKEYMKKYRQSLKVKEYRKIYKQIPEVKKRIKEQHLLRVYNLTLKKFEKMIEKQNNKCAICNVYMDKPFVDHCHKTGKVRGLLCHKCNTALGLFKDDLLIVKSAVKYLKS